MVLVAVCGQYLYQSKHVLLCHTSPSRPYPSRVESTARTGIQALMFQVGKRNDVTKRRILHQFEWATMIRLPSRSECYSMAMYAPAAEYRMVSFQASRCHAIPCFVTSSHHVLNRRFFAQSTSNEFRPAKTIGVVPNV